MSLFSLPKIRVEWRHRSKDLPKVSPKDVSKLFVLDAPKVEVKDENDLLFEYGDRMFNMPRSNTLVGAEMLRPAAFTEERFSLWNRRLGKNSFPVALDLGCNQVPKVPVFGQVFQIPRKSLDDLDNTGDNRVSFRRKLGRVNIPFMQECVVTVGDRARKFTVPAYQTIEAWFYIGTKSWKEYVLWDRTFFKRGGSDFNLASLFRDWNKNRFFYRFSEDDLLPNRVANPEPVRYLRIRNYVDQKRVHDIDIQEQEQWDLEQRKLNGEQKQPTITTYSVS